ncbi:P-loop containing nucleoside triphosphate hydrolase protein [Hypoxylon rubiginosum]|uniref:P-loop containing nucleoside triphosphate hydrolase protein n=1 Tax=Hypoxylon rubiginosum TaxID=110542 RepID=A0ACB9YR95_9PEZI|nr:P-loop containing nucleoside triphosphate hydrolase protein [Hypoxylon rubiginosum]
MGGNWFGRENWSVPFDLQEARKGVSIQDENSILKVVNVLRTSFPADDKRYPTAQKMLMDQDILRDPTVNVSIHSTKLVVYSQRFLKVLRRFVEYYPGISLEAQFVTIEEPYCVIAHHLQELDEFQEAHRPQIEAAISAATKDQSTEAEAETDDEATYRHIDTVMNFVKRPVWVESVEMEKARYSQDPPMCTYRMLWLLYKPGDTVYTESDGKPAANVIQSVRVDPAVLALQPDRLSPYKITIWYLDFDGRHIRRWSRIITIAPFDGEKEISAQGVVPCRFFDQIDSGQRRQTLESEGERWYQLLSPKQVRYAGETMDAIRRKIHGRTVIDCDAFRQENPPDAPKKPDYYSKELQRRAIEEAEREPKLAEDVGDSSALCPCEQCLGLRQHPPSKFMWIDYDLIDPTKVESLDLPGGPRGVKHRYLICSRRLFGFVLKARKWEILDVACCHDVDVNTRAIERLVMPQDNKDMIKALVHRYTTSSDKDNSPPPWGTDFIEDKGHGRIFLLHGSPGVGKTYATECIAEYTGRPLLSLTCGDLGRDETRVEQALSKWFGLAERWGAVMLLDEADVYTEKRMISDLKRNSMVSVFLRCMEYYKGILFLTTNRVGTFDDAFVSRIHVIIHYKNLTQEYRNVIWNQFFDKLEDERDDIEIRRNCRSYVMEDMTESTWNGREIRNAFQTAVALAYYEFSQKENKKPNEVAVLTSKHFEKVCRITLEFKYYLEDVNDGLDENQRAALARSRARDGQDKPKIP